MYQSFAIFSILFINFIFISIQETAGQFRDKPSPSDCEKYCHADCSQYFQIQNFHGGEYSICVTVNVHCRCGLPLIGRIFLGVVGSVAAIFIVVCCMRECKRRSYARNFAGRGGPIRPNMECMVQPVVPQTSHYPISSYGHIQPQLPYSPGIPNYFGNENTTSDQKSNDEEPPRYEDVMRGMPLQVKQ